MIGASARPVPLDLLGDELGISRRDTVEFCRVFGIPMAGVGDDTVTDLFACEWHWHRRLNPQLFTDHTPQQTLHAIREIGNMYEGCHRAALLHRLGVLGKALLPDVRRRKRARQSQEHHRQQS